MKQFFLIIFFFILFFNYNAISIESYVVLKVNNKIVTNVDIDNEYKYLIALSPNLIDVEKKKIMNLAKDSIIREKIKEDEIIKHFDLNVENKFIDKVIKNFYIKMGMKSKNEFENYLLNNGLKYEDIKKKITIETAWNDLIYKKFANKVEIDELEIKNKIEKIISTKKDQNTYFIYEILFAADNFKDLEKKHQLIDKSILEIGFSNTANIHSISDTGKLGGKVGWVKESQLNETIKKELAKLNVGGHSEPITIPGGFLIIKLDNKKKEQINLNFDEEYKKRLSNEKNSQLIQFSEIYFKKIKKNSIISEK